MPDPAPSAEALPLDAALAEALDAAREQLAEAWRVYLDRAREQLEAGWREQLDRVVRDRFAAIELRLHEDFDRAVEAGIAERMERAIELARAAARREFAGQLNQTARRLKQAEGRDAWIRTLLEACGDFCTRAALFGVSSATLTLEMGFGFDLQQVTQSDFPLEAAPAFAGAVDSKDTIVAMGSPRELSSGIAAALGYPTNTKVYLFPLAPAGAVVAILYAESGEIPVDVAALELIAGIAENSIEAEVRLVKTVSAPVTSTDLVQIAGRAAARLDDGQPPAWSALPAREQQMHLRAQRFARTGTARIILDKTPQVKTGRAARGLYAILKEDIDRAREQFRREFIEPCPSMVDYLHQEFVHTLANDRPELLGPDYPGALA
ncbi:MAG: hypothetical protein HYZ57_10680 [Acidobacteria bacterium]|nr:hypothetical protein [Acidobacteriota bacterium]MBI3280294.1 hypothetical protein [Acidobacteriota bacterium]